MILIKEAREIKDLPAVLACEVICQRLKLVQHDILYVIVIKDGVQHEAVRIVLGAASHVRTCLIK